MPRYRAATTAAMTTALEAVKAFCDEESADDWYAVRKKIDEALELAHADQGRPESPNPFDGSDYNPALDDDRLRTQLGKIFNVMADGEQHTLAGIAHRIGGNAPEASISAHTLMGNFPLPTSTISPTIIRTILCRNERHLKSILISGPS